MIFNVRVDDSLAWRFDAWSAERGGRSAALRQLIVSAVARSSPGDLLAAGPGPQLLKLTVRLHVEDGVGLSAAARDTGLTVNAWAAAVIRRRLRDRPTFASNEALSLAAIHTELRRIGVNVNQIARALNTAVLDGRVLALELSGVEDFRRELGGHMAGVRAAFAGNLAYWAGES